MIRRTLEEICKDRGANGNNLFNRVEALGKLIIFPQGFLEAMHNIRLLGNDAAHVDADLYYQIGRDEVEAAVEITKEILKAVYQYQSIMQRLADLKKTKNP